MTKRTRKKVELPAPQKPQRTLAEIFKPTASPTLGHRYTIRKIHKDGTLSATVDSRAKAGRAAVLAKRLAERETDSNVAAVGAGDIITGEKIALYPVE